jgi:hypothetical protein
MFGYLKKAQNSIISDNLRILINFILLFILLGLDSSNIRSYMIKNLTVIDPCLDQVSDISIFINYTWLKVLRLLSCFWWRCRVDESCVASVSEECTTSTFTLSTYTWYHPPSDFHIHTVPSSFRLPI